MASAFENRLRRTIEMAGTDGQAGPVPVMATLSDQGTAIGERGAVKVTALAHQIGLIGRRWAFLGDSITNGSTAGNFAYSYAPEAVVAVGGLIARPDSIEAGVPGESSVQALARLPDVIAAGAQGLVVLVGTNDVAQGLALAVSSAAIAEIVLTARSFGMPVVLCTTPPRGAAATVELRKATAALQCWVRTYAASLGAELADVAAVLADLSTGGLAHDSGDLVHPSASGHIKIMQVVGKAMIRASLIPAPYGLVRAPDAHNLVTDPLNLRASVTSGGWFEQPGGSGTAPTYSFVADTSGVLPAGRWAQQDFDAVSGGTRYLATSIGAGWAVGDEMLVTAHLQIEDVSGSWEADVVAGTANHKIIITNQSGVSISVANMIQRNPGIPGAAGIYNIGPICIPFVVPAGTTAMSIWVQGQLPTGKRCKFRVGCIGAFNLTQMGLVGAYGTGIYMVSVP